MRKRLSTSTSLGIGAARRMGRRALVVWTLLRLPLLAAILYAARVELLTFAENWIGLAWPTETAIIVVSTLRERVVLFALCLVILSMSWVLLAKRIRSPATSRAVLFTLSLILFLVSMTNDRRIIRTEASGLLVIYVVYIVWRSLQAIG